MDTLGADIRRRSKHRAPIVSIHGVVNPTVRLLDGEPPFGRQTLEQLLISRSEAPPAQAGVGDNQPIERIARPAKFERLLEPLG